MRGTSALQSFRRLDVTVIAAFFVVIWVVSGIGPGDEGYAPQRITSAKDERHSLSEDTWLVR